MSTRLARLGRRIISRSTVRRARWRRPRLRRLAYKEDYAGLRRLQRRIIDRLRRLPDNLEDSDIGWCHGDLGLCNIRRREDGSVVFFDFGDAGFILRAAELVRMRGALKKHDAPERSKEVWA
jgi:Ser/Thr protein kinase RdoA (MazF antagonist)